MGRGGRGIEPVGFAGARMPRIGREHEMAARAAARRRRGAGERELERRSVALHDAIEMPAREPRAQQPRRARELTLREHARYAWQRGQKCALRCPITMRRMREPQREHGSPARA